MSAMVSALTQVIGTVDEKPTLVQSTPLAIRECAVKEEPDSSQPVQDQGKTEFGYLTGTHGNTSGVSHEQNHSPVIPPPPPLPFMSQQEAFPGLYQYAQLLSSTDIEFPGYTSNLFNQQSFASQFSSSSPSSTTSSHQQQHQEEHGKDFDSSNPSE
ncbi:hypothetical protein CFP56_021331 [Quercus suber]|uniref:Uncharacterized protein n=1 Tax=Quercus suber TaxID=58331 RepID=A0AAW0KHP5_QUESU